MTVKFRFFLYIQIYADFVSGQSGRSGLVNLNVSPLLESQFNIGHSFNGNGKEQRSKYNLHIPLSLILHVNFVGFP